MPYGPTISAEYATGSSLTLRQPSRSALDSLFPADDEIFAHLSDEYDDYFFLTHTTSHFFRRVILPKPELLHWGIHARERQQKDKLVGLCSVDITSGGFDVLLLQANARGRGIGSQVSRLLMATMFAKGEDSIQTYITPDHHASRAMVDRLGMNVTGTGLDGTQLEFSLDRPKLPEDAVFSDMVRALGETSLVQATITDTA
ncbi:MAG TPA: GNAT family protein [Candidatus Saccharimonadia bacterium]|nr:GNAT family protein [Candidatus Saccharimonadia bacterium]